MKRATIRSTIGAIALGLLFTGCGGDEEGSESTSAAGSAAESEAFRGMRTHMDLGALPHLAEVEHQGLFIDFGTPAHAKYTVGDWESGWGSDGVDGDTTFCNAGRRGRVYFNLDAPGPMRVRVRLRPHGTRALTPYINNEQLQSVFFEEGATFRDVDFALPAEHLKTGENYLLLTFGGVTSVGDEEVSVAVDSLRIVPGEAIPEPPFEAPSFEGLRAQVAIGGRERAALISRRATTLSYYVEVPEGGKLGLSLGFEGEGSAPFKLFATPEGGERAEILALDAGGSWEDHLVDLQAYAGKIVRLELAAMGEGAGRIAYADARILVPQVETRRPRAAKNVIVVLVDTLRADKLRPFNPRTRVRTPVIDRIAERGAVFELAQAPENWTKPSVASVLTGITPLSHGAVLTDSRLPSGATLLSEHLKAQGFRTGGFVANGYVSREFGFDRGWDRFTNYIREEKNTEAENVFSEAAGWIEENRGERFFAYVQTIDPHVPYDPPGEYLQMYDSSDYAGPVQPRRTHELLEQAKKREITFGPADRRRLTALHDAEISQHDHFFGLFLERLEQMGIADETLIVVTSDHGEEFDDHGSWGHGHTVYQELIHVPLLFDMAGGIPARRIPQAVSTLDIPATVTDLLGVSAMPLSEGRSLVGFLAGDAPEGPAVAFSFWQGERRVLTTQRWKFLVRGNLTSTLFDLQADPGEQTQLGSGEHPIAQRYARILLGQFLAASDRAHWLGSEHGPGRRFQGENAVIDPALRDQLGALGYAHTN